MKQLMRVCLLLFVTIGLSACALDRLSKPVPVPEQSTYAIASYQKLSVPRHTSSARTLLISQPTASPGYQSASMIYVSTAYQLKAYANNRWIAPPAHMLMPMIVQQVRHFGYFRAVVSPPFAGLTNYRLDTQVLMLQQNFLQPVSRVQLVMQATIVNVSTNRVLASRRFSTTVSAPGNDPYSGVLAANKAAHKLTRSIAQFVIRTVR